MLAPARYQVLECRRRLAARGRVLLLWAGCLLSVAASAYGPLGHRLIAQQAQDGLSPAAAAEVQRLLDGARLPDVAAWADEIRGDPVWRHTAPWHYVNFARGDCRYRAAAMCPDGQCLVAALQTQTAVLADQRQPQSQRAAALKFVVHFYGDLHQPLHLGYAEDKGGNTFQLNFAPRHARPLPTDSAELDSLRPWWRRQTQGGSNLHRLWDSQLLDSYELDEAAHLKAVRALAPDPAVSAELDPVALAEAACRMVQQTDFYPHTHRLAPDYVLVMRERVRRQLRLGGLRLAGWLNQALDAD